MIGKCGKLSKTRKSSESLKLSKSKNLKDEKLSKSQKLAKLKKKLSKSGNLPHFNAKENEPSFLTFNTKMAFNRLQLAFIKAPILWYFDLKYYIWIETNISSYAIGDMLSQLAFETKLNGIITKIDLS